MIASIQVVQALGRFDEIKSINLERVVLVYGRNGRGKTTLTSMLRSMASNSPDLIASRKRVQSGRSPMVRIILRDGSSPSVFENGEWRNPYQRVLIFDDQFIHENVSAGLDVTSSHRKKLHDVVLGSRGIEITNRIQTLKTEIANNKVELERCKRALEQTIKSGLSPDAFASLGSSESIETHIANAQRRLDAAQNIQTIRQRPRVPLIVTAIEIDTSLIVEMLAESIEDVDARALSAVEQHIKKFGESVETWVREGLSLVMAPSDSSCPFCGADLADSNLFVHYREFFSVEFRLLLSKIAQLRKSVNDAMSEQKLAQLARSYESALTAARSWKEFVGRNLSGDVKPEELHDLAILIRDDILSDIDRKGSAVLDPIEGTRPWLPQFDEFLRIIEKINDEIESFNRAVELWLTDLESTDVENLRRETLLLQDTAMRQSEQGEALTRRYFESRDAQSRLEDQLIASRKELDVYRKQTFPEYRNSINNMLQRWGAGWRVGELEPTNIGSGSSTNYSLKLVESDTPILLTSDDQAIPTFKSTLSAGDRSALALGVFISAVEREIDDNFLVVIDDPVTSLDEHRVVQTIEEILRISGKCGQVIVLSHDKSFMTQLWGRLKKDKIQPVCLEISSSGRSTSKINTWDAAIASLTPAQHTVWKIEQFISDDQRAWERINPAEIVRDLRIILEEHLRGLYPTQFGSTSMLGQMIEMAEKQKWLDPETLNRYKSINNFCVTHHHASSDQLTEEIALAYAEQTLSVVRGTLHLSIGSQADTQIIGELQPI